MKTIQTPKDVKLSLHQALSPLESIEECALLDYPSYYNIGDHLIWLGTIFYLVNVLKVKIKYTASITNFSESQLNKKAAKSPILLQGGGNMGDLWPMFQKFREKIVSQYCDRPIFVMPQSLYFQDINNLKKAAEVFNSHPNLTIFMRDNYSYKIATEYFNNCRVIEAPDMAFQMVNMPGLPSHSNLSKSILFLYRNDQENNADFIPKNLDISDLIVQDWVSFSWMNKLPSNFPYIPGLTRLIREGWQRGLSTPEEWLQRQKWEKFHPYADELKKVDRLPLHRKSWSLMHSGIYQLQQHKLVITNRLHVHILCLILGIPHIVLPGSYYKIESFYHTWTKSISLGKFVDNPAQVKTAVQEILNKSNQ
jgi:pyruvyl transferase EpsO